MPGYNVKTSTVQVGDHAYLIRSLSDKQQYADPQGSAEKPAFLRHPGACSGQLWPAGQVLANAMSVIPIAGRRILEIGCGLGLSSLVLQKTRRRYHRERPPSLAASFLKHIMPTSIS